MDLFAFIGAWEKRETREKFNHDAAERPHVDLLGIGEHAEHNVWGPVESALNVGVHNLVLKASTAEVSDGDPTFILLFHKNIFRL